MRLPIQSEQLNNKILRNLREINQEKHMLLNCMYSVKHCHSHYYIIISNSIICAKFTHYRHKLPDVLTSYFTQNSSIHHRDTRIKSNFFISCISTSFGKRALTYKGPALWNNLPCDLKMYQSTTIFKLKLENYPRDNINN